MKNKTILRKLGSLILILSLFIISSCSKSADDNLNLAQKDESPEEAIIDEKDFTESDEDLSTVDYKEFYDQLSPHGEWIQVQSGEIGLKKGTAQSQFESSDDYLSTLFEVFGARDAKAATDVNEDMVFVWKPSVDLGVSVSGETPVFTPYTNGQWVNTDAGWYFKAPTPVEETVSHYGRWVNSPTAGWLWVPGRVWAPAWVDWKQNEEYVSWAPLPPSVYISDNVMNDPIIYEKEYVIVERKYFLEPSIYKYNTLSYKDGSKILAKEMSGIEGIVIINNIVNNLGPDIKTIQHVYDRDIELVRLHHVKKQKEVIYSNGEYYVYSPGFRKFKNKKNKNVVLNVPGSYIEYDEWIVKNSTVKESTYKDKDAGNDGNSKKNKGNDGYKDNGNNKNKNNKNNDDKNKIYNGNQNNGNKNGDMHNGNENGNKNKSKENGNKSNGKDKGSKNNGKGKK